MSEQPKDVVLLDVDKDLYYLDDIQDCQPIASSSTASYEAIDDCNDDQYQKHICP